jgi:pimeloyl-ACP methyl ester carboxylesterase
VIFLHGNNDTAYPESDCNPTFGKVQSLAQYFADHGYRLSELWAISWQGNQCDLQTKPSDRASAPHTVRENVPDLRRFVYAVLRYTHAKQVDIVAHSYGSPLAREWMRQDHAYRLVRRFVSLDGADHGIVNCGPQSTNYYAETYGFTPDSPVCREVGSDHTPFYRRLNVDETPGPTKYLVIANGDKSFVYINKQDGIFPPPGAVDRDGRPHDFANSARLRGAKIVLLTGQGIYDTTLLTSHLGILNSPQAWSLAFDFLSRR